MTTPRWPLPPACALLASLLLAPALAAQIGETEFVDSNTPIPAAVLTTIGELLPERSNAMITLGCSHSPWAQALAVTPAPGEMPGAGGPSIVFDVVGNHLSGQGAADMCP